VLTLRYRDEAGGIRTRELAATPAGALVIGRSPACDLAINHPSVSRQHARVSVREDGAYLADLGSTHGTFVRGQRISGEVRLAAGDTFTIGQVDVAVDGPRPGVAVALTEDRQVISGAETLYRRVEDPAGEGAARGSPGDAERLRRLLSEIGRTLVTVQSLGEVLERVIDLVFESVRAERAILMLRDAAADALTPRVVRYHDGRTPGPATISRTVVNMVMRDRVAMLAADALNDARLEDAGSIHELNIRSFMCAPLWNRSDIIGVLYVDTPRTKRFSVGCSRRPAGASGCSGTTRRAWSTGSSPAAPAAARCRHRSATCPSCSPTSSASRRWPNRWSRPPWPRCSTASSPR